ncbi:hypothetical protein BG262_05470 [Floricoccus penangensis]|uniref:Phage abortive infection protein n=1 Tax=Floricoccus penangensis TaxID=1859475 RepID=A0A9Q5JFQ0_9LACT|nr:hypothetical protein [Floricoccus penangensis]OFI46465.1 hypothetical protein BG262_05470 [Floricoccus penangensis]
MENKDKENKKPCWEPFTKFSNWISEKLENVDNRKLVKYLVYFFIFLIVGIILLPSVMWLYTKIRFYTVTDRTTFSRLEFVKISLQLLGIILTFIVFQNTLSIQKVNKAERDSDKIKSDREKNYKMVHDDFFMLLDNVFRAKRELINNNTRSKEIRELWLNNEILNLMFENNLNYIRDNFYSIFNDDDDQQVHIKYKNFIMSIQQILFLLNDSISNGFVSNKQKDFFLNLLVSNINSDELCLIAYSCILDDSSFDLALEIRKSYIFSNIEKRGAFTVNLFGSLSEELCTERNVKSESALKELRFVKYQEYYEFFIDGVEDMSGEIILDESKVFNNILMIEKFLKGFSLEDKIDKKIEDVKPHSSLYSVIDGIKIDDMNFYNK